MAPVDGGYFAASLCPPETLHPTGIRHDSDRALLRALQSHLRHDGGGPGYATTTMEFLIYETGFNQGDFGTAALYGLILS